MCTCVVQVDKQMLKVQNTNNSRVVLLWLLLVVFTIAVVVWLFRLASGC